MSHFPYRLKLLTFFLKSALERLKAMPAMRQRQLFSIVLSVSTCLGATPVWGMPPPDDLPEEVLRTEIITIARSPIDGKLLSAAEYAQLRSQVAQGIFSPEVDPKFQQLILLLRLRRLIKTIVPFAPF